VGWRSDDIRAGPHVPRFAPSLGGRPTPPELLEVGPPCSSATSSWRAARAAAALHLPPPPGAPSAMLLPRRELRACPKRRSIASLDSSSSPSPIRGGGEGGCHQRGGNRGRGGSTTGAPHAPSLGSSTRSRLRTSAAFCYCCLLCAARKTRTL
jgi:hypothetical protein